MMCRACLSFAFAFATALTQGCSSTSGASPYSPGTGMEPSDSGMEPSDTGAAPSDSGTTMTCDGALPTMGAGGGAACTACRAKSCVSESAACAADCACGPIEACLENSSNHNFTECPNAVAAGTGGNFALTMLTKCLDTNCLSPCFTGGGSDGGGGDL